MPWWWAKIHSQSCPGRHLWTANSLALLCSICKPSIVDEAFIITMIMVYLTCMLFTVCFRCVFCLDCVCLCLHLLEKHELHVWNMIHKYNNYDIPGLWQASFELGNKTCLWWNHLVNWNTFTGGSNFSNRPCILHDHMGMPRSLWIAPKTHVEHFGILACVNCLGNMLIQANVCRTPKPRWFSL